jgi:hypothetical protein
MNDDANGFAQAAFGFGAGCHAHGFLGFLFFIDRRAQRQKTIPARSAIRFASRKSPDSDRVDSVRTRFRVLDGCRGARNQRRHQNFISH